MNWEIKPINEEDRKVAELVTSLIQIHLDRMTTFQWWLGKSIVVGEAYDPDKHEPEDDT